VNDQRSSLGNQRSFNLAAARRRGIQARTRRHHSSPITEVAAGRPFNIIPYGHPLDSARRKRVLRSCGAAAQLPLHSRCNLVRRDQCWLTTARPSIPGITRRRLQWHLGRDRFTAQASSKSTCALPRIHWGRTAETQLQRDGFNLLNRTNVAAVNQLCDPLLAPPAPPASRRFLRRAASSVRHWKLVFNSARSQSLIAGSRFT